MPLGREPEDRAAFGTAPAAAPRGSVEIARSIERQRAMRFIPLYAQLAEIVQHLIGRTAELEDHTAPVMAAALRRAVKIAACIGDQRRGRNGAVCTLSLRTEVVDDLIGPVFAFAPQYVGHALSVGAAVIGHTVKIAVFVGV